MPELESTIAALRAQLKELEDLEAIRDVKTKYFRLVDEKDWEGWR